MNARLPASLLFKTAKITHFSASLTDQRKHVGFQEYRPTPATRSSRGCTAHVERTLDAAPRLGKKRISRHRQAAKNFRPSLHLTIFKVCSKTSILASAIPYETFLPSTA